MDKRYVVLTTFNKGRTKTVVYRGNNYARAVECTNFWDEKQDTWLIDTRNIDEAMDLLLDDMVTRYLEKIDALVDSLEWEGQLAQRRLARAEAILRGSVQVGSSVVR